MCDADVLYSDVRFTRGEETGAASSSAPDTIYSEVKIPKEPPCKESSGTQQINEGRSKVKVKTLVPVVAAVLVIVVAAALAVALLTKKTEKVIQGAGNNLTDVEDKRCEEGWEKHNGSCYIFSTNKSTWEESRKECQSKGGDLVKIDSIEEQSLLEEKLKNKMEKDEDKFWIGLTDSEKEETWLWVDGQPLNESLKFWNPGEPDNWDGEDKEHGEDCVRMGERGGAEGHKSWFDKECWKPHKYICEK